MHSLPYSLTFDEFRTLASRGNRIPLYREILADFETPVSAFAKIDHGPSAYLLESVEGGENWARYSFLGSGSPVVVREEHGTLLVTSGTRVQRVPVGEKPGENPLDRIQAIMSTYRPVTVPGLPRFVGGAVRSEEHTSELQSPYDLVCRLLLEKKKNTNASSLSRT